MSSAFTGIYTTAEAGVFWDIDECEIPEELNASETVQRLRDGISQKGHRGRVTINAYGDKMHHDFTSTGVKFNQFPYGDKHERHKKIMEDIVAFASENPEPSIVVLVLEDVSHDFVELVKHLKDQKQYRFILIEPPPRPRVTLMIVAHIGGGDSDSDSDG